MNFEKGFLYFVWLQAAFLPCLNFNLDFLLAFGLAIMFPLEKVFQMDEIYRRSGDKTLYLKNVKCSGEAIVMAALTL